MQRRRFLAGSIATTALALTREATSENASPPGREYYQMRRYSLRRGPQTALTESYFAGALIPALGRLGMGPVGAFTLDIGPDTPIYYLLIPSASLEKLANLDEELRRDAEFMHAAAPFRDAPANAPAFLRVEVSLLRALRAWPKAIPPASFDQGTKRIFQLRTYESPSDRDHVRKVEMMNEGEIQVFKHIGMHPVFFADVIFGARMPCLTYMLAFDGMPELEAGWERFFADPGWKTLSAEPRYAFDQIVTNIANLVVKPLSCSQI